MFAGRGYASYGMEQFDDALADLELAKSMGYNNETIQPYIADPKTRIKNDG